MVRAERPHLSSKHFDQARSSIFPKSVERIELGLVMEILLLFHHLPKLPHEFIELSEPISYTVSNMLLTVHSRHVGRSISFAVSPGFPTAVLGALLGRSGLALGRRRKGRSTHALSGMS